MRKGTDLSRKEGGLFCIHHNLPGKSLRVELNPHHHLIIPIHGPFTATVGESTWKLEPGEMLYIPAGVGHYFTSPKDSPGERLVALIETTLWKKEKLKNYPATVLPVNHLIKEIMLYLLLNPNAMIPDALIASFMHVLSMALQEKSPLRTLAKSTSILQALEILEEECRENIKINELAKRVGLAPKTFQRRFSLEVGRNPKEVHAQFRMNLAAHLLKNKNKTVTEVCFEVGHSSLSQFTKTFLRYKGKLPSEY